MRINPNFRDHLTLPVIAAPMFLVSGPELLLACCKNGIVGSLPSLNQRSTEGFEQWIVEIETELAGFEASNGKPAAPYAINLIVNASNTRLEADLDVCVRHQVPIVITSLGAKAEVIEAVHSYGGVVYHDVINLRHAKKAAAAGVDGLIAVCAGAGGHAGFINPFALTAEIRSFFDKTLILSGCISRGGDIAAAQLMGADFAYMGTRFINATESLASPDYQQMVIDAGTADIIHTPAISGVHANFMRQSLEQAGLDINNLGQASGSLAEELNDESKAWKNIWSAGQGACAVRDVLPVADLIKRLNDEYQAAIEQRL